MTNDLARVLADIDTLLPPGAPSCDDLVSFDAMRWSPVDHDDHPETVRGGTTTTHTARVTLERPTPNDRGGADVPFTRDRPVGEPDRGSLGMFQQQPPRWPFIWQTTSIPPVGQGTSDHEGVVIERAGWYQLGWPGLESAIRAGAAYQAWAYQAYLESLTGEAQHATTNLQHHCDTQAHAQHVIDARRHRNTGPQNPRGIDGRARRHQHPTKAPARNARPATQGAATQVVRAWLDEIGDPEPWPTVFLARRGDGTLVVGFDGAGHGPAADAVWVDEPWDVGL